MAWDDPAIEADWGVTDPVLSARDQKNPGRAELDPQFRPHVASPHLNRTFRPNGA